MTENDLFIIIALALQVLLLLIFTLGAVVFWHDGRKKRSPIGQRLFWVLIAFITERLWLVVLFVLVWYPPLPMLKYLNVSPLASTALLFAMLALGWELLKDRIIADLKRKMNLWLQE